MPTPSRHATTAPFPSALASTDPASPGAAAHAPQLDDMLMYRLYRAWSSASPVFVRLCEGRFGITRREWRLLATAVENGPTTSAGLAGAADLDLVRTSRTLGTLCEKGWLQRQADPHDARTVRVQATPAGRALYQQVMPEIAQLNTLFMADLDEDERELLLRLLRTLESRGARMAADNIVEDKASRHAGGTRRTARTAAVTC